MNDDGRSAPRVVALAPMEDKVATANRVAGNILAPEADGHGPLLPKDPLLVLNKVSKHWRVVTDLRETGRGIVMNKEQRLPQMLM